MSLLATFVAMLGKQWLNRYLRHTGRSMVERCGDRQRKFDGLEKWPFRLFIESLPIMLQIALLLLTCGLSRYMWSVNTSVARVIISFTVLGTLFYIGIVVAGTSLYECPFQTPASIGLRYLRDSGMARKILARLSPSNAIQLIYASQKITRRLVVKMFGPSNIISFMYTTWMDTRQGFVSTFHHIYDIMRYPFSRETPLSCIVTSIHRISTKVGYQIIITLLRIGLAIGDATQRLVQEIRRLRPAVLLPVTTEDAHHQPRVITVNHSTSRKVRHQIIITLLRIDRVIGNVKQRLVQEILRFRHVALLPVTAKDAHHQPRVHRNGPGLRVYVQNLEALQRQNDDNARCVYWILRKITDPEAIDSDIRLAGTIRWFDGDSNHNPPYDSIVSTFKTCFDSAKQLYPGMRDRAYFSARAILQINVRARAQSHEYASKYSVPPIPWSSFKHTDPDLHHVLHMLKRNSGTHGPILRFPRGDTNTHAHSLWMSNLFMDLTRVAPNPTLKSYKSYLSAAVTDHRPVIANILLLWYMFLGGHVEEETLWAIDKSYAVVLLSLLSGWLMFCTPAIH